MYVESWYGKDACVPGTTRTHGSLTGGIGTGLAEELQCIECQ
jgi:hypothetical protein